MIIVETEDDPTLGLVADHDERIVELHDRTRAVAVARSRARLPPPDPRRAAG